MHTLWMVRHTVHRAGHLNPTGLIRTTKELGRALKGRGHLHRGYHPNAATAAKCGKAAHAQGHTHHPRQTLQALNGP